MKMQDPELIAKTLRAVLHPFKNGVPLSELQAEYRSLTGEWIPFRHLGHGTLEGYLESIPGVVRMEGSKTGEVRTSHSLETAFLFVKSACLITSPLCVLWVSRTNMVACVWCTNVGRNGNCDIDHGPLVFLPLCVDQKGVFAKRGKFEGVLLETGFLAEKMVCMTVDICSLSQVF